MKEKRGAIDSDALWVLGILIFVFYAWWASGGPSDYEAKIGKDTSTSTRTTTVVKSRKTTQNPPNASPWYKVVKITNRGNAATEKWADFEYITIRNTGKNPVTISGWALKNGRDSRVFLNNFDKLTYGVSDTAVIPNGVRVLWKTMTQTPNPIVLGPKEQAIITTGNNTKKTSYLGVSFKENICTGYINEFPGYALKPTLAKSCPIPRNDADLDMLDDGCYKFVKSLKACHTPVYHEQILKTGELRQYLDKTYGLSSQCQDFVRKRFTYEWCVLNHLADKNFYRPQWRIYLGRRLQMWGSGREYIRLYDASGLLVDEINY